MTCFSIGIDPASIGALAGAVYSPTQPPLPRPEVITAVQAPTSSRLYDGQPITAMIGYGTFTAPGNFTSSTGSITGATVTPLGTATDVTMSLAEGDIAGYRVTVTGTGGTVQSFDTALQVVEFDVRVISTAGNEVEIDLNDIVADGDNVDLDIVNTPYTGVYTVAASSLRQTNPFVLPGTHLATYSGAESALTTGDTLTMQDPLAYTIADSLSITARAWLRNGTPIAGATGTTYTLVADDLGTVITPQATVTDNLANATVSDGATVTIAASPSAGVTAPSDLASGMATAASGAADFSIDDSSLSPGNSVVVMVFAAEMTFTGTQLPAATISTSETVTQDSVALAAGRTNAAVYRYEVGTPAAGKTFTIPSGLSDGEPVFYRVLGFSQAISVHDENGVSVAAAASATATLDTANNSVLVAVGGEERPSSDNFAFTYNGSAVSNQITQLQSGNDSAKFGFEEISTGALADTVVVDHDDGNFHGSVCAVTYI